MSDELVERLIADLTMMQCDETLAGYHRGTVRRAIERLSQERPRLPEGYDVVRVGDEIIQLREHEIVQFSSHASSPAYRFLSAFLPSSPEQPKDEGSSDQQIAEAVKGVAEMPEWKRKEIEREIGVSSAPDQLASDGEGTAGATSRVHVLKAHGMVWDKVESGEKRFEVRRDDRAFNTGDVVVLRRLDPMTNEYDMEDGKPRDLSFKIGFILFGGQYGIETGYCVMQLEPVSPAVTSQPAKASPSPTKQEPRQDQSAQESLEWWYKRECRTATGPSVLELCCELDRRRLADRAA